MVGRVLPNLNLMGFYAPGDDGWGEEMSLNLLKLSVLAQAGVSQKVAVEPGAPAAGTVILLDETNATHPNAIAAYDNGAWVYFTPSEGWLVYDRSANKYLTYNTLAWVELAAASSGGGGGGGAFLPGSETVLASQTVAGAAEVIFNSALITGAYKRYRIEFDNIVSAAAAVFSLQLSPDNGVTWRTAGYAGTRTLWQLTSTFTSKALTSASFIALCPEIFSDVSYPAFGELTLHDPANAAIKTMAYGQGVMVGAGAVRYHYLSAGEYSTTEAHNAVRIRAEGSTFSGTVKLIGVGALVGSGGVPFEMVVAVGDETTAIAAGNNKVTFRMPRGVALTEVRASVNGASSSGLVTVDINEEGVSILSTKLTIDAGEKTSVTAATPAVISDAALASNAEMTIDIDTAGTGATGLKVTLLGTRT